MRCIVDLELHLVSAPGVWLPCKEDVYLSVSLFNQYRNTRLITSTFPLLIHEKFRFEKTYYTALDPGHVAEMLADELVIFEMVQLSEYSDGACRLASYSTNCRDFLYPYPTLAPSYSAHDREVLMCRTVAFPGISPKLEFSTKTTIKESYSPELDALDDAVEQSRSRSRTRRKPTVRSRSLSPMRRKLADVSLDDTVDPRPPFVVRKLDDDLIGRKPSAVTDKGAESKPKRSTSPVRTASSRLPYTRPLYRYYDDIDLEVDALTRRPYTSTYIPRSLSPISYRQAFYEKYGYYPSVIRPYSPTYYERVLQRERELARARRLDAVYDDYYKSIDDLDLELRLARLRANRLLY